MYQIEKMPGSIDIGFVGETKSTKIEIDMTEWMKKYPDGVPSIIHIRPGESKTDAYVAVTEFDSETNVLTWEITAADIGTLEGDGDMQIWLEVAEDDEVVKRKKNKHVKTRVTDAVNDPDPTAPTSQAAFLEQVTEVKTATITAKEAAEDAQTAAETAQGAAEDAQEAAEGSAEDAEAYAKGTRDGSTVTSEDPAYHNNAKYYSEQAGASATAAGTAKTGAETAKDNAEAWAKGTKDGTAVPDTDPAYHNNAKYYSEQAAAATSSKANLTVIAPAFDQATANAAGSLVTYTDGKVYFLESGHTAGTTWANTTKAETNIGALIGDVKTAIDGLTDSVEEFDSDLYSYEYLPVPMDEITATPDLGLETGYISIYGDTGGTSSYHHTKKIAVGAGDVLEYKYNSGVQLDIRFVTAYNGETIVPSKGQSDQATSYTVPEGVTHVILSLANSQIDNIANLHRYYTAQGQKTKVFDVGAYVKRISKVGNIITAEEDSLTANTDLVLESNLDGKKEGRIDFWAKFSSFDSVTVGHGKGTYGGYIVIDDTNAVVYYNGTAYKTYTHGLTIADFIEVHIEQTDMAQAKFSITSSGGQWKSSENALWHGSKGDIFAKATTALSDIRFSASFPDMRKDVFVFGDSYITMGDDTRWPYYIKQTYNATNLALFGWGGEGSTDALTCFNKVLAMVKPKIVAWFIGMNDGDTSSAINSDWKTAIDEVISTCRTNGIKLVLATIPNTPTVRNTYKNTYVKESGFDYVDFAKAVNAENAGATWYTGMLSNDNVHPTALGGKALASRLIADFPQIV